MPVTKSTFDSDSHVIQYAITSSPPGNLTVKVIDFGATITNVIFLNKNGNPLDLVLGFDTLSGYKSSDSGAAGATVGRFANRIKEGQFNLNGKTYQLDKNEGGMNHLHGGIVGFSQKMWEEHGVTDNSVSLKLVSLDGDQGYPGTLQVIVTFTVTNEDELVLEYEAKLVGNENVSTILNLTNHSYFNLSGLTSNETSRITDHKMIISEKVTGVLEKDHKSIPTGKVIPLADKEGSDFSFPVDEKTGAKYTIGDRINQVGGYDHCYVVGKTVEGDVLANVKSPSSNISMEFRTDCPGFQFYAADFLSDKLKSKSTQGGGKVILGPRSGFCLEAQTFPNSINQPEWKTQSILNPGGVYKQRTSYKFFSS